MKINELPDAQKIKLQIAIGRIQNELRKEGLRQDEINNEIKEYIDEYLTNISTEMA